MIRKIAFVLVPFLLVSVQSKAQSVHIELGYQSILPFVHFQLRFGGDRHRHDRYSRSYRRAYMRGYMNGVNDQRYYSRRYREMRAYKAGYHDGFKDRGMLIRLKGRNWWHRYRFSRRDYRSPSVAIRVWLKHISIVFEKGHRHRRWRHRSHHWNRGWHGRGGHYRRYGDDDDDDYYEDYEDYREHLEDYRENRREHWEDRREHIRDHREDLAEHLEDLFEDLRDDD